MKKSLLLFVITIAICSCSPKKFITHDYHNYAKKHQTIAILPFENYYTGRIPAKLSDEDVKILQQEEAVLFQRSLYFQLLEESRINRKRKNIQISIQNIDRTNKLLAEEKISIEESWFKSPEELAEILDVDAVVKVDVHKNFWLSNEESAIVDIATIVSGIFIPGINNSRLNRTSEMYINANLIDGEAGVSLWTWNRKMDTDWQRETDEAIARVNHQISKRFPYRRDL